MQLKFFIFPSSHNYVFYYLGIFYSNSSNHIDLMAVVNMQPLVITWEEVLYVQYYSMRGLGLRGNTAQSEAKCCIANFVLCGHVNFLLFVVCYFYIIVITAQSYPSVHIKTYI